MSEDDSTNAANEQASRDLLYGSAGGFRLAINELRDVVHDRGGLILNRPWSFVLPRDEGSPAFHYTFGKKAKHQDSWIRFELMPDGDVYSDKVDAEQFFKAPELAKLKAAIATVRKLTWCDELPPERPEHEGFAFEFGKHMWVKRVEQKGDKRYIPYVRRKGAWIEGEPWGDTTLYGAEQIAGMPGRPIMIHEGPKAASAARLIATGRDPNVSGWSEDDLELFQHHPWRVELARYVHLGWHGAKLTVNRLNLTSLRGREVWLFPDMDEVGLETMEAMARRLATFGCASVMIGSWGEDLLRLGEGWDVADPPFLYPPDRGALKWSSLVFRPHLLAVDDDGKLRRPFVKEWVYSSRTTSYHLRRLPFISYSVQQLNSMFAHQAKGVGTRMLAARSLVKVDQPTYDPTRPDRVLYDTVDGHHIKCVNLYTPGSVKVPPDVRALPSRELLRRLRPVWRFLRGMIPDREERDWVVRWIAHLVWQPGVKIRHALMFLSEKQGVGKNTLYEMVAHLIGPHNAALVPQTMFQPGAFNRTLGSVQLAFIGEVFSPESNRQAPYEGAKSLLTDDTIMVNEKHVPAYSIPNRLSVMEATNHADALALPDDDRRHTIITCRLPITRGPRFFKGLRRWFFSRGGDALCLELLRRIDQQGAFEADGRAFLTSARREMVERASPRWHRELTEVLNTVDPEKAVLLSLDLVDFLHQKVRVLVNEAALTKEMARQGWKVTYEKPLTVGTGNNRRKSRAYVKSLDLGIEQPTWKDVRGSLILLSRTGYSAYLRSEEGVGSANMAEVEAASDADAGRS